MAVLISDSSNPAYNGNLSQTNGFYTVSAHNLGFYNNTATSLAVERLIPVTFTHTANMIGVCLAFATANTTNSGIQRLRNPVVQFQENVSGTWTTRLTTTITSTSVHNGSNPAGMWIIPVTFSSTWAVDTVANKWRFRVTDTGSETNRWNIVSSDGTNFAYATWVDVQATAVSGADAIVIKDKIYQDVSFNLKAVAITGVATVGVCAVGLKESDPTPNVIGNWEANNVSGTMTLGVDGFWLQSAHAGIKIGSENNRAVNFTINALTPTIGTQSVICSGAGINRSGNSNGRSSFIGYGTYPAKQWDKATNTCAALGTTLDLEDASWLNVGDIIAIGKRNSYFSTEQGLSKYQITNITGNTITFTPGLISNASEVGAWVIRDRHVTNGYYQGLKINIGMQVSGIWSNYIIDGAVLMPYRTVNWHNNVGNVEESAYTNGYKWKHFLIDFTDNTNGNSTAAGSYFWGFLPANTTAEFEDVMGLAATIMSTPIDSRSVFGPDGLQYICNGLSFKDCYFSRTGANQPVLAGINGGTTVSLDNVVFDGLGAGTTTVQLSGSPLSYAKNVTIWGGNSSNTTTAANIFMNSENLTIGRCQNAMMLRGSTHKNLTFTSNLTDFCYPPFSSFGGRYRTINANPTFDTTYYSSSLANARAFFENVNVAKNDFTIASEGVTYRTGAGLSDTTTRTTGNEALRFESRRSDRTLNWSSTIPTGNIQGKTMTFGVWVKINNSAYWAGTNQMPRITVSYDNDTATAYGEAAQLTDWQFIFVPITPTTTFGQVTVTLSTLTDAVGSNAYVYFADFTAPLPQGSQLNLGSMQLWSDGLPITPLSLATTISASDVWAADPTQFGASTVGDKVNKIKKIVTGLQ